jgi:hypothetical protein
MASLSITLKTGQLIVNADDWGRDHETTDRTMVSVSDGAVPSVSAMAFMEDSGQSATIVREQGIDAVPNLAKRGRRPMTSLATLLRFTTC